MKRMIMSVAVAIMMACCTMSAKAQSNVKVTKTDSKTFVAEKVSRSGKGSGYKPTGCTYIDVDGNSYEIHVHTVSKGKDQGKVKCYIQRVSKTSGKPYWKEINVKPEELEG